MLTKFSVAPNVTFFVDDMEDEWAYEDVQFDFIRARFLSGAILNWPRLIEQAYQYVCAQFVSNHP